MMVLGADNEVLGLRASLRRSVNIAALAFLPLMPLSLLLGGLGIIDYSKIDPVTNWRFSNPTANFVMGVLDQVVLTPLVETALMFAPIWVSRRCRAREAWQPFLSGVIWALLHARGGNWPGLLTFWPFYLFTIQLIREEKHGVDRAWCLVTVSHGMYNAMVLLMDLCVLRLVRS